MLKLMSEYDDEVRDFCLLVSTQTTLSLVMSDVPIIDQETNIFTEKLYQEKNMFFNSYTRFRVGDGRIFTLELQGKEDVENDFKLIANIHYPLVIIPKEKPVNDEDLDVAMQDLNIIGKILEYKDQSPVLEDRQKQKILFFRPTVGQGEAVVNEIFVFVKETIAILISGVN